MSIKFDMLTHRVWKKIQPTHLFHIKIFHPPRLFKSPRLIFLDNFLPTTFIQDPTFIRDIRVLYFVFSILYYYSLYLDLSQLMTLYTPAQPLTALES